MSRCVTPDSGVGGGSPNYDGGVTTGGAAHHHDQGLDALFEESPDPGVHTSAAAEIGFVLGLAALLGAPFSVMHAVSLALGAVGVGCSFVGMAMTSNAKVAGRLLVPLGIAFGVIALLLVSLRYLGVDTAFGDGFQPALHDWLRDLNTRLAQP